MIGDVLCGVALAATVAGIARRVERCDLLGFQIHVLAQCDRAVDVARAVLLLFGHALDVYKRIDIAFRHDVPHGDLFSRPVAQRLQIIAGVKDRPRLVKRIILRGQQTFDRAAVPAAVAGEVHVAELRNIDGLNVLAGRPLVGGRRNRQRQHVAVRNKTELHGITPSCWLLPACSATLAPRGRCRRPHAPSYR